MLKGILKYLVIGLCVLFILNIVIENVNTQLDDNNRGMKIQPEIYYLEPPANFFIENYEKVA
jgi:hypothetical protein